MCLLVKLEDPALSTSKVTTWGMVCRPWTSWGYFTLHLLPCMPCMYILHHCEYILAHKVLSYMEGATRSDPCHVCVLLCNIIICTLLSLLTSDTLQTCSIFYTKRFCLKCALDNLSEFPLQMQQVQ